jgi:hypothetical protein
MNGYNDWKISKVIHKEMNRGHLHRKVDILKLTFPYIKGTINQIGKILRSKNIVISLTPMNTIRILVDSVKDSLDLRKLKSFYQIPCSYGKVYIGEIGQSLQVHLKEHAIYNSID